MRRVLICAFACLMIGGGVSAAAPAPKLPLPAVTVSMTEYAYTPGKPLIDVGDSYLFQNDGTVTHGAKIGPKIATVSAAPGGGGRGVAALAGSFPLHCQYHPDLMKGTLKVAAVVDTSSGTPGTVFNLTWSTGILEPGAKMKVQLRRNGGDWVKAGSGTGTGIALSPVRPGSYEARVMFVNASGRKSGWSPKSPFTVTPV